MRIQIEHRKKHLVFMYSSIFMWTLTSSQFVANQMAKQLWIHPVYCLNDFGRVEVILEIISNGIRLMALQTKRYLFVVWFHWLLFRNFYVFFYVRRTYEWAILLRQMKVNSWNERVFTIVYVRCCNRFHAICFARFASTSLFLKVSFSNVNEI